MAITISHMSEELQETTANQPTLIDTLLMNEVLMHDISFCLHNKRRRSSSSYTVNWYNNGAFSQLKATASNDSYYSAAPDLVVVIAVRPSQRLSIWDGKVFENTHGRDRSLILITPLFMPDGTINATIIRMSKPDPDFDVGNHAQVAYTEHSFTDQLDLMRRSGLEIEQRVVPLPTPGKKMLDTLPS